MEEKQITACCPKLLERFLEGKIAKHGLPLKGNEEDKTMEEEIKADVISLVERCNRGTRQLTQHIPCQCLLVT